MDNTIYRIETHSGDGRWSLAYYGRCRSRSEALGYAEEILWTGLTPSRLRLVTVRDDGTRTVERI